MFGFKGFFGSDSVRTMMCFLVSWCAYTKSRTLSVSLIGNVCWCVSRYVCVLQPFTRERERNLQPVIFIYDGVQLHTRKRIECPDLWTSTIILLWKVLITSPDRVTCRGKTIVVIVWYDYSRWKWFTERRSWLSDIVIVDTWVFLEVFTFPHVFRGVIW